MCVTSFIAFHSTIKKAPNVFRYTHKKYYILSVVKTLKLDGLKKSFEILNIANPGIKIGTNLEEKVIYRRVLRHSHFRRMLEIR